MKLTRPTIPSIPTFSGKLLMLHLIASVFLITPCLHAQRTVIKPGGNKGGGGKGGGNQQNLISTEFNNRTDWRLVITPYKQGNPDRQNSVPVKPGERVSVNSKEGTRYGIFRGNDRIDQFVVEKRNKPYVILPPQTGNTPAPAPPAPPAPPMPPQPVVMDPVAEPQPASSQPEYLGLLFNDLTAPIDAYYHITDPNGSPQEIFIASLAPSDEGTPLDLIKPGIFLTFREAGENQSLDPLFFYEVGQEKDQVVLFSELVMAFMPEEEAVPAGLTDVNAGMRTPVNGDTEYGSWVDKDQIFRRTKEEMSMTFLEGYAGALQRIFPSHRGYNLKKMDLVFLSRNPGVNNASLVFEPPTGTTYKWHTGGTEFRLPFHLDWVDVGGGISETQAQRSVFFSSEERSQTFEINATSPQGLNGGYSRSESEMEKTSSVSMVSTQWASTGWLTLDKRFVDLHPEFIRAVRNLGDGYEEHKRFFEIFGTHYPVSTLYGGLRYTQQYVKSEEAASRLQKGWKAGYEKKAQVYGVEVAASLGFSETTTNESASGSSVDTSGTISYGTLAPGSQTSMEPIKVHLEPIVELILPTLFAATSAGEVEAVNQKRTAMRSHLDVYLTPSAGTVASRSPRVFEMKVTSVTLIDEDDDFTGPAPELYQSIYIIGRKQEAAAAKEISSANAWSKTAGERVPLEKNQKLSLKEHVARTVVFPKAVKRADGGWDADYELAKYDFQIHVNLYEHDNTATDYITGNRTVKVTELAAKGVLAGSPMEGSFDVSGDGAGTVRVKYQLQEAPFDKVQNPPLSLPSYPDYVP